MKRNMKQWIQAQLAVEKKTAMPVLSFPSIQLMDISVRDLISSSETQAKGMELVAKRCKTAASVSMMDLSVEAEAFGSTIRFSDEEVPTVIGKIVETMEDAEALKVPEIGAGRAMKRCGLWKPVVATAIL